MAPNSSEDFPRIHAFIYLAGGLVLEAPPGDLVTIRLGRHGDPRGQFKIARHADLLRSAVALGQLPICCQLYTNQLEARGIYPPDARALGGDGWFLVRQVAHELRNMSHVAMKADDTQYGDVVARGAFALRAAEMRLVELASRYSDQLRSSTENAKSRGSRFSDLNSPHVTNAIHATFAELAIVRDNLAEIVAWPDGKGATSSFERITTMRGLISKLKKSEPASSLHDDLLAATVDDPEKPGWLAELSAYRNVFVHAAPLEHVSVVGWTEASEAVLAGNALPAVYRPLPSNILKLSKDRSAGFPFATSEEWLEASSASSPSRPANPDALEYLHMALLKLAHLLKRATSPPRYSKEMPIISESDLVGPLNVGSIDSI